jgi:hypothetical protein
MSLGIPISPKNDFLTAFSNAHVEPLKGSEYTKNDTLDKYIFEPILPIKKFIPREFKSLLSPIEEEEELNKEQEGGNIDDKRLFIAVLLTHGGYSIDNSVNPVTLVTRENAQLIIPGNKFDGYKTLTICGPAPPGQINLGSVNLIDDMNDIIKYNIHRFTTLLTEKVSSVEMPEEPILVKPASASTPRHSHSHSLSVSASSRGRPKYKKYKLPPGISGGAKTSRLSKLSGIIKSVSSSIKSKFFSLVSGCVKIVMNFNVDYAVLDLRDNTYNRIQKHVVDAIICMSRNGVIKVDSELFTAFTYSLYKGLQQSDRVFLSNTYPSILVNSVPGTTDYTGREYFINTMNERYPSVRVLVNEGAFQPSHIEKVYTWNPVEDARLNFGIRVFSITFRKKNNNTNTSILPSIDIFDIPVREIFDGITPKSSGYYHTCLSDLSSFISSRINAKYYSDMNVKKIVSILDLSCSSFHYPQVEIPKTIGRVWGISKSFGKRRPKLGGGSGSNKTKRKNERNERNERNNSKIKNRITRTRRIKRTRKNSRS